MAGLTGAQVKTELDNIAYGKSLLDITIGTTTTAATILYAMQQLVDRVNGYDEEIQRDLAKPASNVKDLMAAFKLSLDHKLLRAIDSHLRKEHGQGIDDFWADENYPTDRIASQVAELCRVIGIALSAFNCFAPVTTMATYVVTGAAAGTFTDGDLIDGNLYGPADLELEVTAKIGADVSVVATVIGTDEDGNEVLGVATVVAQDVGATVDVVPDQTGKQFQDVINITITGGTADDAFKIQSKVDRAVAA